MRCQVCGGPWHPASGDWDERWQRATCGACHRGWIAYVKQHFKRRWGGKGNDFYKEAETSIRAA